MKANWWPSKRERHADGQAIEHGTLALRAIFLSRLYRLVLLDARKDLDEVQRALVNHALDATYRDCQSVGARAQARALLGLPR
jgi:hypothetical protein